MKYNKTTHVMTSNNEFIVITTDHLTTSTKLRYIIDD